MNNNNIVVTIYIFIYIDFFKLDIIETNDFIFLILFVYL